MKQVFPFSKHVLKKHTAIEVAIMVHSGRARVWNTSPKFAFVFEICEWCCWVLKARTILYNLMNSAVTLRPLASKSLRFTILLQCIAIGARSAWHCLFLTQKNETFVVLLMLVGRSQD